MKAPKVIELLEDRIAPATLVNATTVSYQDADGDNVIVKVSKPVFEAATINSVLVFSAGSVNGSNLVKQQLKEIQLGMLPDLGMAVNTDLSITATRSAANGGDGLANVGLLYGAGLPLGKVAVDGDLAQAAAVGDGIVSAKSFTAQTLGALGTSTGASALTLFFSGALGSLTVKGDVRAVDFQVSGTFNGEVVGDVGTIKIGGSIVGDSGIASGRILVAGTVGSAVIGGNIQGGAGYSSGSFQVGESDPAATIKSLTIGGSIIGGSDGFSGRVNGVGFGTVKIGHDIRGGAEATTGVLTAKTIASLTIGGSVLGGALGESGRVFATGAVGPLKIAGDVEGGAGTDSGQIQAGSLTSVTLGGSLLGGGGTRSGQIHSTSIMGAVKIGHDLRGGGVTDSGRLLADGGGITSLTLGGSLVGGGGTNSGRIDSAGVLGSLTIGGSIEGAGGGSGGRALSTGDIKMAKVGHDIVGGSGDRAGRLDTNGNFGPVTIGGSIRGGSNVFTGRVFANGNIASVSVLGDMLGGAGGSSGTIQAGHNLGTITIAGDLVSGGAAQAGAIVAGDALGAVTVKGSVRGTATQNVLIVARGQMNQGPTTDVAIKSVTVGVSVEFARILAGFDSTLAAVNADAQMGALKVGTDWIASTINVGGILTGQDGTVGTNDDVAVAGGSATIASKIASITIGGSVVGTTGNADHFAFVAQEIVSFKVAGTAIPLLPGKQTDSTIPVGGTAGDTTINEA